MQQEQLPFPPAVDYHSSNDDTDPAVLRVNSDTGRYSGIYFSFSVGTVGGEYDSLIDGQGVSLTRSQVAELIQHLAAALAANS